MKDDLLQFIFMGFYKARLERLKIPETIRQTAISDAFLEGEEKALLEIREFYNDLLKKQNPDAKELPCICCGKITKDIQTFWEDEEYPFCSEGCIDLYYDDFNLKEDARNKLLEERNNPAWYDA